jgi:hypothetical protein
MGKKIMKYMLVPGETYDMIDSKGESWSVYYKDDILISPLSLERWTKRKLIDLYNNRDNKTPGDLYILKNPDSKKLPVIIAELAKLLKDNRINRGRAGKGKEMKQIKPKDIQKVLEPLLSTGGDFFDELLDSLSDEQPGIFEFLDDADELNDKEHYYMLYIALMGWHIIKTVLEVKTRVSEDFLYEQHARNITYSYECGQVRGKSDEEIFSELFHQNNQPDLMSYLINLLTGFYDRSGRSVREKMFTVIALNIKTVVDCLVLDEKEELAETCDREFSDENFKSVKESVKGYIYEFRKSPLFMKLKHEEKDEAEFIISTFSEMMYMYFLLQPRHWNTRRAAECIGGLMPAKVVAGDRFFKAVEPVLVSFLTFCSGKGYVTDGEIIAGRLNGITEALLDAAGDENLWNDGKALLKKAETRGVDISDRNEIENFINIYNRETAADRMQKTAVKKNKPGRNDPCPCGSGKKYKKCCGMNG